MVIKEMSTIVRKLLIVSIISFLPALVFSQSLSLVECLQKAREASFKIKASAYQRAAAQRSFLLSKTEALPQFSAELSYQNNKLQAYSFRQQWALVRSNWALGNLLLKTSSIQKQNLLAAQAEVKTKQLEVIHRAARLFIEILKKSKQDTLLQNRLQLLQTHYDVARALWQAGSKTEFDVLQTESEILRLKEEISILRSTKRTGLRELALLLNLRNWENLTLKAVPAYQICQQPLPNLETFPIRKHPLLKVLQFQIKAQKLASRLAQARQLPHLSLAGGYVVDEDPTGDGNYWLVSAGINFPLFMRGATRYQKQQAEALAYSLESQKNYIQRELSIQIQRIFEKLKQLKNLIHIQQKRLKTSQKTFQFAEANYQAGVITNLEYLSAQQKLTEIQITLQETQLEYVMKLIEFYITSNQLNKIEELMKL